MEARTPEQKRAWNLKRRYGLSEAQYQALLQNQNMKCALCGGEVRGILCHPCNIKLPVVEDMGWVMLAWAYLEGESE